MLFKKLKIHFRSYYFQILLKSFFKYSLKKEVQTKFYSFIHFANSLGEWKKKITTIKPGNWLIISLNLTQKLQQLKRATTLQKKS